MHTNSYASAVHADCTELHNYLVTLPLYQSDLRPYSNLLQSGVGGGEGVCYRTVSHEIQSLLILCQVGL